MVNRASVSQSGLLNESSPSAKGPIPRVVGKAERWFALGYRSINQRLHKAFSISAITASALGNSVGINKRSIAEGVLTLVEWNHEDNELAGRPCSVDRCAQGGLACLPQAHGARRDKRAHRGIGSQGTASSLSSSSGSSGSSAY